MTKNLTTGGLIRERRIAQALSLGQLASRLGVPPASVRAWERGDDVLPERLVPSVADALGLQAADLLKTLPAPSAPPEPAKESKATPAAAAAPPATTPKKTKSAKAKSGAAAEAVKKTEVDEVVDADALAKVAVEPAVAPVAEAELVEDAIAPVEEPDALAKMAAEPAKSAEPAKTEPADADEALVETEDEVAPAAATSDTEAADSEATDTSGTDQEIDASEEPAAAAIPLTDLPTEMVDVIPVAFTDEVTQAVARVPARPSVDDLASTAAVDALLSGSATATSSTQVVGAPVTVVAEKLPYWKDPNQRWRYWARAIATVAIMGVFLIVLGWALGELSDALGGFLDQFSDASDADPLNR